MYCEILLGILSSVFSATFTVVSSKAVEAEGTVPANSQATYSRTATTGQKGQMTEGNATDLTLSGWGGCRIKSVVLSMHSNKTGGAGSMEMLVGKNKVWSISDADFASAAWNGAFSNSWEDISSPLLDCTVAAGEDIVIHIEASKNSLFINSYTLTYEVLDAEPHTVGFETGLQDYQIPAQTESQAGAGIALPLLPDTAEWKFAGWSETEIAACEESPVVWPAGKYYYPKANCTLWAVYSDAIGMSSITDYQTGDYVVANSFWNAAMTGDVCLAPEIHAKNKVLRTQRVTIVADSTQQLLYAPIHAEMLYHVELLNDSLLTIHNTLTGNPIGFKTSQLDKVEFDWHYRILEDRSLLVYHVQKSKAYYLCFGYDVDATCDSLVVYAESFTLSSAKRNGLLLFAPISTCFTTWPFGKQTAVPQVEDKHTETETTVRFGIYEIRVRNGKKTLYLCK